MNRRRHLASSPASIISDVVISGVDHLGRHYLRRRSFHPSSSPAPLISIAIIITLIVSAFTPFFNTTLSKPVLKLANLVDSLLGLWISKHILSGQCRFRPDSGEREFRSVLGPTRNKLQRKLPEMKLKKKKKHMKSKYEKPKKLGTLASPTTTLKQRQTQKRRKLFVAQARSQGITMSRTVDAKASLLVKTRG
ncbi:hypothetical protein DY000_02034084 [Brassica cretica]|uniref:DUF4408 domain-containing protein n=1 Tax=Brassica cretica TaxID=69181 RepID=A0ABQ7DBS0_BRACR|nr:hypothetical protein DY000_02034084 [Brassica cretica]